MKLKQRVGDFRVRELLDRGYLSEKGDHRVYRVTKRKLTSVEAARAIAQEAGVEPNEVHIAGLKDRQGITTQYMSVARGKPVLRIYSVAHLLVPIRDFPGQDMNVYPSNYEPPEQPEPEVVQTYDSSEQLAELVRTYTGEGTWEDEGVRITVFRNHLFVHTYPAVHGEIERFLDQLPH